MVDRLNGSDQVVQGMTNAGLAHGQAVSFLDQMVQSQALMLSTNHVFLVVSILMVVSAGAIWLAPKPKMGAPAPSGH